MIKYIVGILVALGIGVVVGRYLTPPDVQIKEVEKQVTIKNEQIHTIETKQPDGTVIKETTVVNKDVIIDTSKKVKISESSKPQWMVGASYQFNQVYGVQVDRRIIGPIFAGAFVNTNKDVGVALRLEF